MTPFFRSRWVGTVPDSVRDVGGDELPHGFRASGVAAGIKPSGGPDVAIMTGPDETTSAVRFTRSAVIAAPVSVTRERARLDALRTVAVNSGNANAATGRPGLDEAARMQGAAGMATGTAEDQVAVCSTGVIGVQLDGKVVVRGLMEAAAALRTDGAGDFQRAIMTTDRTEKRCALEIDLPGGSVRLTAQCKGAGMLEPRMATLLCFVQTDAKLSSELADLLLGVCVKRSFERITVDGQTSTNDTVLLQCSGASGVEVEPESESEAIFGQALDAVLRQLAIDVVADGEGAERIGRVVVRGGNPAAVERVSRTVANSQLVKTALNGADPNWGRVVQAAGMAMLDQAPLPIDVTIEGVTVCSAGAAAPHDGDELAARLAQLTEVEYEIGLPGGGFETEVIFSDLGHGYITINADYTT